MHKCILLASYALRCVGIADGRVPNWCPIQAGVASIKKYINFIGFPVVLRIHLWTGTVEWHLRSSRPTLSIRSQYVQAPRYARVSYSPLMSPLGELTAHHQDERK